MTRRRRAYIVLTNGLLVGAFAVGTLLIAVGPPVVAQEQWNHSPAAHTGTSPGSREKARAPASVADTDAEAKPIGKDRHEQP